MRPKHIPERTCVGTGAKLPKRELIRIVRTPEGELLVDDSKGRTNGRGCYVAPSVEAFEAALKKNAFQRAFKQQIQTDQLNALKDQFVNRLLDLHK